MLGTVHMGFFCKSDSKVDISGGFSGYGQGQSEYKVNYSWLLLPQHQYIPKRPRIGINWNPPLQTQIYLVKLPLTDNIVKQDLLNRKQLFKKFSVYADSGPLSHVLWCCGSRSQEEFTFIQIGSSHTVFRYDWTKIECLD